MTKVVSIVLAAALALLGVTASTSAKERKAVIGPRAVEVERSLFSGSESRLIEFGALRPDCTIPIADIRIVKPAAHGEVRFEEAKTVVTAQKYPLQKRCFGKPVDAVRTFYKANKDYVGKDRFVVDIDTKIGAVWRYTFIVDVR